MLHAHLPAAGVASATATGRATRQQQPVCRGAAAAAPPSLRLHASPAAAAADCPAAPLLAAATGPLRRRRGAVRAAAAPAAAAPSTAPSSTAQQDYDIVVVGGGLSGLVTGQALAAQHGVKSFLVTEARERVGGNITSRSGGGYMWEEGPNSFQPNDSMLQIAVRGWFR